MAQIFPRSANTVAKASIFGFLFLLAAAFKAMYALNDSSYYTMVNVVREQPVPFSHKHHVAGLGIDCRYCHTTVETSATASIPPTKTCMNCHVSMWADSPMLEPVRESFKTGKSIEWVRVHDLPDFAYFDHSIHVSKGMGCATCHGQVDEMPLMMKKNTLRMAWCLDCHRNPEKYVRPREHVFDMKWEIPEEERKKLGPQLVKEYNIKKKTDCSVCHR
jgi:hypothetical protein